MRRIWICALALCLLVPSLSAAETLGAWQIYWDDTGAPEARRMGSHLERLVMFEAMFNWDGSLYIPEETDRMLKRADQVEGRDLYLSVVNDIRQENRVSFVQKSKSFLEVQLSTRSQMLRHLQTVLSLADRYRVTGIEVDYENLGSDTKLWGQYVDFLGLLYQSLKDRGLKLRVCIQWDGPLYVKFPEGPDYVVMCYNLYGNHSGPGPKADATFLREVAQVSRALPGRVIMALATGGYVWKNGNAQMEIAENDAAELASVSGSGKTYRDTSSGAMVAQLKDGRSMWWADAETLRGWMDILKKEGYTDFDFFRLGGGSIPQLTGDE